MENLFTYGILGIFLMIMILFTLNIILTKKIKKLTAGENAVSLEKIIIETNKTVKELKQVVKDHQQHIIDLQNKLTTTLNHVSIKRFDALREMGGKQSFAISLLDDHKNGVVISSMYTRDRMNVFAKQITKGESQHTLTEEEKYVINH